MSKKHIIMDKYISIIKKKKKNDIVIQGGISLLDDVLFIILGLAVDIINHINLNKDFHDMEIQLFYRKMSIVETAWHNEKLNVHSIMRTYFNILLVDKQFNRVGKLLIIDWLSLLKRTCCNYRNHQDANLLLPNANNILKSVAYYDVSLPLIRDEIDSFMTKNKIVYRTPKTQKIYKGYVGVRKLATIKIKPLALQTEFKKLTKKYQDMNKRNIVLYNYLFDGKPFEIKKERKRKKMYLIANK